MTFYADSRYDLPAPWKQKSIIFYAQGLKIYGQIPYLLQKRLQAVFYSNNAPAFFGGRIIAPTMENNYTVIPYRRQDSKFHSLAVIQSLLDWLYKDKGFRWGIAVNFHDNICEWNAWKESPETFVPAKASHRSDVLLLFLPSEESDESCNRIGDHRRRLLCLQERIECSEK